MEVKVGISARHVHVTKEDLEILFGKGYELTIKCFLSQPGQFASNEQVILKGPKNEIQRVRILGPVRNKTQVEIAKTDAVNLGLNPPVCLSGDLNNASEITIIGPKGQITRNAAIIAARHIHVNTRDLKDLNLNNNDVISIEIDSIKGGILNNVYVRTSDNYDTEIHLDTDDSNALLVTKDTVAKILK